MLQYVNVRRDLVDFVAHVAGRLHLHDDLVHLAMAYIDRFRSRVQEQGAHLLLSAVVALIIAAKFLDAPRDHDGFSLMLSWRHVLAVLGNPRGVTTRHLAAKERQVLDVLRWELFAATPSSFARAYLAKGIFSDDETVGPSRTKPTDQDRRSVWQYTKFFCDVANLHGLPCTFGVSVVAAASVSAARTIVGIDPAWPDSLACRLGHTHTSVEACARVILDLYRTEHGPEALDAASGQEYGRDAPDEEANDTVDLPLYTAMPPAVASASDTSLDSKIVGSRLQDECCAGTSPPPELRECTSTCTTCTSSGAICSQPRPQDDSPSNVDSYVAWVAESTPARAYCCTATSKKRGRKGRGWGKIDDTGSRAKISKRVGDGGSPVT